MPNFFLFDHRTDPRAFGCLQDLAKCLNERGMCHGQLSQHNEAWEDYEEAVALLGTPRSQLGRAQTATFARPSAICTAVVRKSKLPP